MDQPDADRAFTDAVPSDCAMVDVGDLIILHRLMVESLMEHAEHEDDALVDDEEDLLLGKQEQLILAGSRVKIESKQGALSLLKFWQHLIDCEPEPRMTDLLITPIIEYINSKTC